MRLPPHASYNAVVQLPEQTAQVAVPRVDQIVREFRQATQFRRDLRTNFEGKTGATHVIRNSTDASLYCHRNDRGHRFIFALQGLPWVSTPLNVMSAG